MKSLLDQDNPLSRRLSININLKQMDYYESSLFYPNYSKEDKVRVYSAFGGLLYYNRFIDETKSVKENIIRLIASPDARLLDEMEENIEKDADRIANTNEILMTLARRYHKFSDIFSHSHVTSSPTLVDVLHRLISMDILKKECPIHDESNKKSIYSISDHLTFFYYRYISRRLPDGIEVPFLCCYDRVGRSFDVKYLAWYGHRIGFYIIQLIGKLLLKNFSIRYHKLGFISRSGFILSHPDNYHLIDLSEMYD